MIRKIVDAKRIDISAVADETDAFVLLLHYYIISSVTRKKSPNVYEGCPKMIALEK